MRDQGKRGKHDVRKHHDAPTITWRHRLLDITAEYRASSKIQCDVYSTSATSDSLHSHIEASTVGNSPEVNLGGFGFPFPPCLSIKSSLTVV